MRKRIWLLSGVFVFGLVVVSRDALLTKFAESYIHRNLASYGCSLESMERNKNTLKLKNLSFENGSLIEDVEATLHLSLFPLELQPSLNISRISIEASEKKSSESSLAPLFLCLGNPKIDVKLSIQEGQVKGVLDEPFAFSFKPGLQRKEMGTLSLQDGNGNVFLATDLKWEKDSLVSKIDIFEGKATDLMALTSLFQSPHLKGWTQSKGTVTASVQSRIHPQKGLEEMQGKIDLKEISFSHPDLGVDFLSEALTGTLSFSSDAMNGEVLSFWKKVELFLTFEDTHLRVNQKELQIGAKDLLGELRLHPSEDPYLKMGGEVLSKNLSIPFEIEGKGQMLEKGNVWLQTQADFFLAKTSPHLSVAFSQTEEKITTLEVECRELSPEVFNVLSLAFPLFKVPECRLQQGTVAGKFTGTFEGIKPQKLTFSECTAENFAFHVPALETFIQSQSVAFSATLDQKEELQITSLNAEMRKADVFFQNKEMFRACSSKLQAESGEFLASYLEGFYHGIWGSVQVLEPGAPHLLHLECKAFPSNFASHEKIASSQNNPVFLALDIAKQEEKAHGVATLRFLSSSGVEEDVEIEATLEKKISRSIKDLFGAWDFSTCKGAFKTEKLSSETGSVWMKPWLGALSLQGFLKGEGEFDGKGITMDVSQADFALTDGMWDVSAKFGSEEKKVQIAYGFKENLWKGTVPVDFLKLQNSLLHLEAEVQDSLFFFEGDQFWTDHWQADVEGSKLFGKLLVDPKGVHISSKAFEGTLLSLKPLLSKAMPGMTLSGLNGLFSIEDQACTLEGKKEGDAWQWDWKFAASLKDMVYDLDQKGKIQQAKCVLEGSSKGEYKLREVQGIYASKLASCPFALSDIDWSSNPNCSSEFSFLAKDGKREWMYMQGKIGKQADGISVALSPRTHLLGVVLNVAPFTVSSDMICSPIQFSSSVKLEQVSSYLKMWQEMGLSTLEPSLASAYQGTVQVHAMYNPQKSAWKASLQSSEISHAKNLMGKVNAVILGEGSRIKFDSCQLGSWNLKGSLDFLPTEWSSSSLMLEWEEGKCLLKGKYIPASSKLHIPAFSAAIQSKEMGNVQLQGSFEGMYLNETASLQGKGLSKLSAVLPASLGIGIESSKEIPFSFDSSKGIEIEKSHWDLSSISSSKQRLGKISAKAISFLLPEKRLTLQGGSILVPKEAYKILQNISFLSEALKEIQVEQEIDLSTELDLSAEHKKISGTLKNGSYSYKGSSFEVKQAQFLFEQDNLYASCQTKYQEEPLCVQLQVNTSKNPAACLLVKESPEKKGISFQFKKALKEGWFCDSAEGSFKGISLHAKKEASKNIYDLEVSADLTHVPAFLPKLWASSMKKWGLGKGYNFQGRLTHAPGDLSKVISLKGDVSGEQFQFLGKSFDAFSAKLDFSSEKGKILGVKLEDEVVNLSIKNIDFAFNPKIKSWDITSPLVYVKDFAPTLLLKGGKERGLEIKNLSIYELSGALNNIDSFEAKGALYFSSLEKKQFSFWDIPLGLMKDWGLDPGILTPVTGEADFVLKRGCFYFTALRNVYSEGKRSQFYLAEPNEDAYLSLDGNWHVDLAMKQNVVWKMTEDLVLSIRGTVEKPKYSFKSNKRSR